ncbi:MAG: transcription-repair coupling factor, partial [Hyphomicrobiales bacterium]
MTFRADDIFEPGVSVTLTGVADGLEGLLAGDLARLAARNGKPLLLVARDGQRLSAIERNLGFFASDLAVITVPGWDCLPYDRVGPTANVLAQRLTALSRLARGGTDRPTLVIASVNAAIQRVPTPETIRKWAWSASVGNVVDMDELVRWLEANGFMRSATVRDTGEYAVRGGIVDLFAPGATGPVRLDFFGDTLETIRPFDPETQRSTGTLRHLDLVPMSEVVLDEETIQHFRNAYRTAFGVATRDDALYQSISEGRRHAGMEHWLGYFHDGLSTLFDFLPGAPVLLDHLVDAAVGERLDQIADHYEARLRAMEEGVGAPYKPAPPETLYLAEDEWTAFVRAPSVARMTP